MEQKRDFIEEGQQRRYVQALGEGFSLEVAVGWTTPQKSTSHLAVNY